MKARNTFEVHVRRTGRVPSALADPERVDQVEVVDVTDGETVLLDCTPHEASRLGRALRADLSTLDADSFRERWSQVTDPGLRLPERANASCTGDDRRVSPWSRRRATTTLRYC